MANGINAAKKQMGILQGCGILLPTLVQISCWLCAQNVDSLNSPTAFWQELLTHSAVLWCPGANMVSSRHPEKPDHLTIHAASREIP